MTQGHLDTIEFHATNMTDRKRCEQCGKIIERNRIAVHAEQHGFDIEQIRIEPGLRG